MINQQETLFNAEADSIPSWLRLTDEAGLSSILDNKLKNCPAQYANKHGIPFVKWENVNGTLKMLNTHFLHYVLMPDNHIVVDFDLKDPITGEKSERLNLQAASHWPPTYAEFNKSCVGLHLHYIYNGDINLLKSTYSDDIEIKVFKGKSSLRRRLTKCNKIPIRTLLEDARYEGFDDAYLDRFLREHHCKLDK